MIRDHKELKVWQKSVDLAIVCYRVTTTFPKSEVYGLTSQIQKSAVSIAANIAEGHGREHLGDYLHHLSIAYGSLMELETHLIIAERLGYGRESNISAALDRTHEIGRMLNGLSSKLRSSRSS